MLATITQSILLSAKSLCGGSEASLEPCRTASCLLEFWQSCLLLIRCGPNCSEVSRGSHYQLPPELGVPTSSEFHTSLLNILVVVSSDIGLYLLAQMQVGTMEIKRKIIEVPEPKTHKPIVYWSKSSKCVIILPYHSEVGRCTALLHRKVGRFFQLELLGKKEVLYVLYASTLETSMARLKTTLVQSHKHIYPLAASTRPTFSGPMHWTYGWMPEIL